MKRSFPIALLLLLSLQGCGQTPSEFRPLPSALGDLRGVALGFEGLLTLGPDEGIYAAWINLDNGGLVGLGAFNVNGSGQPVDRQGNVIERFTGNTNLFSAATIVVSIEPQGVIGDTPGNAAILQGPFLDGIAELSVPAPLFVDQASGSYRVFTPTDGPGTNEASGVWGVDTEGEATLLLPPLNAVYRYEHYMVIGGVTLTMGRFVSPTAADFSNPWSGTEPAPAFPGEDFLANAPAGVVFPADLSGAQLLLTLEPVLSDTIDPSQLVILEATLPAGLVGGETIELVNRTANFPVGTAVIY